MRCQICYSNDTKICTRILSKTYWECKTCFAKFLDVSHYLSAKDEYAHYCTHQNEIYDPHYRKFLSKLVIPLKRVLTNQKFGLDYGCGPGPALSIMLDECGFEMSKYDPFFPLIIKYFPSNLILLPVAKQLSIFLIQMLNLFGSIRCLRQTVSLP